MKTLKRRCKTRLPWVRKRQYSIQGGVSKTDRSQAASTDINNIVKQYARTGDIPTPRLEQAQYGDVSEYQGDLTERLIWAEEQLETARDEFTKAKQAQANADANASGTQADDSAVPQQTPPASEQQPDTAPEPETAATG